MVTEAPSTVRARRLLERRSRGVAMVAPVAVGEGGIDLLVNSGLLKEHQTRDRKAVGAACLAVRVAVNRRRRPGPRSTSEIRAPFQSIPIKLPSYKIGAAQKRPYCQKP